jgi:pimeloyl-ACP methyl ester carboxylesterase
VERFHVLALDQRGHGESGWVSPPAYATSDFASDLHEVMDVLGWARMSLVGHSMGGHNSMAFAAWHPERVDSLTVVDARPAIPPERLDRMHERGRRTPRRHPTAEAAVRAFRLLPPETNAVSELLSHVARAGIAEGAEGWGYRFDPAAYEKRDPHDNWLTMSRIQAPTLVVRGELSPALSPGITDRMLRTIPRASLAVVPGAYHHVTLDAPEAFASILAAFLKAAIGR